MSGNRVAGPGSSSSELAWQGLGLRRLMHVYVATHVQGEAKASHHFRARGKVSDGDLLLLFSGCRHRDCVCLMSSWEQSCTLVCVHKLYIYSQRHGTPGGYAGRSWHSHRYVRQVQRDTNAVSVKQVGPRCDKRACLGASLAVTEAKMLLAVVGPGYRYSVEPQGIPFSSPTSA